MKIKFYSFIIALVMGGSCFAQTIVSTSPENKKVILEEFTGIGCVFCPQGHQIAQAIKDASPDDVFLINIHVGSFAVPGPGQPDFRTPFGTAIANQSNLVGYPAGTVNRHVFPGQSQSGGPHTAMSRGQWSSASNQVLGEASYLNMAVEAELDISASEISVHVEAYYTGNSPQGANQLNVALLQNNTLGPQTGGGMGNNYPHQHRLVHMITGQWGESISPTTQGTFIDRNYTYTIPAMYNNVPVDLEEMELVVFMTETNQEVISGNGAFPTYTNLPFNNDAALEAEFDIDAQCGIDYAPEITIQNRGNNPLTSLAIEYSINGGATETYNWTGNLGPYEKEDVQLDPISYAVQSTNTINFSIPNDDDNTNNTASNSFSEITFEHTNSYSFRLSCDANGSEITWMIENDNGEIVQSGGPYAPDEEVELEFNLDDIGCHKFTLTDTGGDGQYYFRLTDSNNNHVLINTSGFFGEEISAQFKTNGVLNVGDASVDTISIVPNPATSTFTISNAEGANIVMYDMQGREVHSSSNLSNSHEVNVSNLVSGIYFVQVERQGQVEVKKLVVN